MYRTDMTLEVRDCGLWLLATEHSARLSY